MENWYQMFLFSKKDKNILVDFTTNISLTNSLSNGINNFLPPKLYRDVISKDVLNGERMTKYTATSGHPTLTYGIQLYEQMLASLDESANIAICKYIAITAGATSAINYLFSYLAAKKHYKKLLVIGLNYYLFELCAKRFDFKSEILMNNSNAAIAPTVKQIESRLQEEGEQVVILTLPFNPSGEMYSYQELVEIMLLCKRSNSLLILDKCQMDELAEKYEFVNIGLAITEAKAENEVVVINSFSKVRSIAGARIGYIFSNNCELIEYVSYLNEVNYYNHTLMYENAILIDLFFRLLSFKGNKYTKVLTREFRNIILLTLGNKEYQEIYRPIFKNENLESLMKEFKQEISFNSEIIFRNYNYCKVTLQDYFLAITDLKAGFNFCIKILKDINQNELEFCNMISKRLKMSILTQHYFCGDTINSENGIWLRISAAVNEDTFKSYIDNLKIILRSVYESG